MKVFITGASGFVGQSLLPYLSERKVSIFTVGRNNVDVELSKFSSHNLDIADALIHLAGKAHDLKKTSDDSEYYKVNTDLTIKLYQDFLNSSCSTFIFISSVKAVADEVDDVLYEDAEPNPKTVYGLSKLKAEEFILNNLPEDDKKVFILRPCMIHGPGNKGNLNLLFGLISKGIPYPLALYENKRSFLSVENLSFVIYSLLSSSNVESGVYNLCDNEAISTNELVSIISNVLGRKPSLLRVPKPIISFLSKLGNVLPLPINEEKVQKLTESYVVSNTKITKSLGQGLPIKTKEGLNKTIASFKEI